VEAQEIRDMAADPPVLRAAERYEHDELFVGTILGEQHDYFSPMAQAFLDACCEGEDEDCDCGIACDSDCPCC
jgi:hypothetical protein